MNDNFIRNTMLKSLGTLVVLYALVFMAISFVVDDIQKEAEKCGGIAKCAGKAIKDVKKDFEEGLNE